MLKKKNNKGFTLVELLVVIAIIGILAVVAVPALFKNIEKGKIADLEADISAIRSAALSVYADTSEMKAEQIDGTGTGTINTELEGLSKPFGGTYKTVKKTITSKNMLLLEITPSKEISVDGAKKLKQDLGDKYVTESGTEADATGISASKSIYIKLISE